MKKRVIIFTFMLLSLISYSQENFSFGIIPSKAFLAGFDFGGGFVTIDPKYSQTGKKMHLFDMRLVPKIAFVPIDNLMVGTFYEYEFYNINRVRETTIFGYGGFIRYYLPFINKLLRINKSVFLNNRLFFLSEIYLQKSNITLLGNGDIGSTENLNTIFYGAKVGINFRLFNRLCANISFVQNFDNQNNSFKSFHEEIGFEYIFSFKNNLKEKCEEKS